MCSNKDERTCLCEASSIWTSAVSGRLSVSGLQMRPSPTHNSVQASQIKAFPLNPLWHPSQLSLEPHTAQSSAAACAAGWARRHSTAASVAQSVRVVDIPPSADEEMRPRREEEHSWPQRGHTGRELRAEPPVERTQVLLHRRGTEPLTPLTFSAPPKPKQDFSPPKNAKISLRWSDLYLPLALFQTDRLKNVKNPTDVRIFQHKSTRVKTFSVNRFLTRLKSLKTRWAEGRSDADRVGRQTVLSFQPTEHSRKTSEPHRQSKY